MSIAAKVNTVTKVKKDFPKQYMFDLEEVEKMLGALMATLRKRVVNKKSFSTLIFSFTFLSLFTSFTVFASTGKGGQPGAFLSWGAGARALGMGKAYVSVVEDATSTLWNPGGLALVDQKEITALHAILWADTNYDYLSYVNPTLDYGTFGLSILFLNSGGFEGRDPDNKITGTFSDTQFAVGASYGASLISTFALSLGGNIKYYSHSISGHTNGNIILDFGVLTKPFTNFKAGLSIHNLINLKTGEETQDVLPILARIGVSYQLLNDQLLFSGDFDSQLNWYLGSEYKLFNPSLGKPFQIAIRMGINYEEFTVGFGASYKEYGLDYAFSTHELGGSHRFSASAKFGESMTVAREEAKKALELVKLEEANSNYKRAIEDYKQGTYKSAIEKVTRALELSPENPDSQRLFKKLKVIVPVFPMLTDTGVESELTRKAINYYIEGDTQTALDIFSYLLYKQPENDKLKGLYKTIGEEVGVVVATPSETGINPVQAKLLEALGSFYEGKFTNVVKLCNEVLRLEPGNVTALERLGSAYYKLNQKREAKEVWEKALMLNPDNKVLRRFVDKLEKEIQQMEAPQPQEPSKESK